MVLSVHCRAVGLEPSADTFTTLMAAYAESGAAEEIEKVRIHSLEVCFIH